MMSTNQMQPNDALRIDGFNSRRRLETIASRLRWPLPPMKHLYRSLNLKQKGIPAAANQG